MRLLLFLLLTIPFFSAAQINRSAREFASERIREYVVTKLFKGQSYKSVSFGEIKEMKADKNSDIAWAIEHKFEIKGSEKTFDSKAAAAKPYKFLFYLDDKMKVLRAEVFYSY